MKGALKTAVLGRILPSEAKSWWPIAMAPDLMPSTISPTPPSCELAKTWISTRPLVRSLTSLATSSAYRVCGALATPTWA